MINIITHIIGYSAAAIGTSLMLPQVIKSLKTKKVDDISFGMLWLYITQCVLWAVYGILISAFPVVICNIIACGIGITQMRIKVKYTKH